MEGWQLKPFEECVEPVVYTTKVQRKDFLSEGTYPIVSQEEGLINGFWDNEADLFRVDRPVVVFGDHTRALKFVDFDFVLGADGVKVLRPKQFLHPRYFFYQLHTARLDSLGYARHYRLLKEHLVGYPAYDEQRHIVAILDEAFEAIATAKANTEKNLQNAREAFQEHLVQALSQARTGWVKRPLGRVTSKIGSGATPLGGEDAYKAEGISLVRSLNVYDDGFRFSKLAYLDDAQAARLANVELQPRDVLLNITGASVARCCVVPEQVLPARVNQHVAIIRPIKTELDAEFLHYLLIARPSKAKLLGIGAEGGSTRQAITKAQLEAFVVEFPAHVDEQRVIVGLVDEIKLATEELGALYSRKLEALDELKKSLLHQAFTGQLTAKQTDQQLEAVA